MIMEAFTTQIYPTLNEDCHARSILPAPLKLRVPPNQDNQDPCFVLLFVFDCMCIIIVSICVSNHIYNYIYNTLYYMLLYTFQ